jgi:hypothetical protein
MCHRNPCCHPDSGRRTERLLSEEISLLREFIFLEKHRRNHRLLLVPVPPGTLQASDED